MPDSSRYRKTPPPIAPPRKRSRACGGDESSGTANVTVNGAATAISATVKTTSGNTVTITVGAQDYLVKFAGTVGLTINSSSDNVWIAPNQPTGTVNIAGDGNNVIFLPGASVVNFLLTASTIRSGCRSVRTCLSTASFLAPTRSRDTRHRSRVSQISKPKSNERM